MMFRVCFIGALVCVMVLVPQASICAADAGPAERIGKAALVQSDAVSEQLRLSLGYQGSLATTDRAALDLAMEDERYLPVAFAAPGDRAVRLAVEVPPDWSRQIAVWREERTAQRRQLVPLSAAPVWLKSDEPLRRPDKPSATHGSDGFGVLWLQVSSRGTPAGQYRIPLRVRVEDAQSPLTIELHVWPVSVAGVPRPFHMRGYYMLTSLTGGYEVNELSIERLDAFFQTYTEMGGNVFDWTVNWPAVFPHVRVVGTDRSLNAALNTSAAPIDLEHLPGLDFSYFDPWFEVARRRGVTRFEAHVENVASERWQWALDAAFGKGCVKTGTPQASQISAWVFGELKRHVERQGFHGFFAKISDEILPENIPPYLVTARVARQAGWRPFTTITATIPRTAEHVRAMDPWCDQWQLSFRSVDEFFRLRQQRYALAEVTVPLDAKWSRYTNGGAERTWSARNVFGAESLTGIPAHEVETLVVLEDGQPLTMSGNGGWGNRKRGIALMHAFDEALYLSPSDDREPKEHRIDLKIVRRRADPAGEVLVSLDPGDEIWCYGGPGRPDRLPYGNTWSLPTMALYRGLDGYAQWAFQWWKDDHRIVWLEPQTRRIVLSPAYCGFRDGWRDAVLFSHLIEKVGRAAYERIIGPHATATLRVAATQDPTYPVDHANIPLVTSIANGGDLSAVNAARREALKMLTESTRTESFLGHLAPIARSIQKERGFPMDYAHRGALSVAQWRSRGRAEVQNRLAYWPKTVPLDIRIHSVLNRDGYEIRTISFAGSPHYRIPAYLLVPHGRGPFPGIVALHDHGGFFTHGKEKLVVMDDDHPALKQFRQDAYGGRAYAEELARRGFVVIVPDAFYWGQRRLQYAQPPEELQKRLAGLKPEETQYVIVMNRYLLECVPTLHMWLSFSGTLWGGIVNYDDRRSVDVLASLAEVDPNRIGCLGLSGGGFRSTYLTGMEPRIKASVITGWMTSVPTTLEISYSVHPYMFDSFGLHANLDHPDVASFAAPDCAVFVQNCARDRLFTREGMEIAVDKIRTVYFDLKCPERFQSRFYDVPHQFNVQMQEDAFAWLEKWLR